MLLDDDPWYHPREFGWRSVLRWLVSALLSLLG